MLNWIKNAVSGPSAGRSAVPPAGLNQKLVALLRDELQQCEALYRKAAAEAIAACPDQVGDPQKFREQMDDLHRGVLVKTFMEIAQRDRRWHPAERHMAGVLLEHVWGADVAPEQLSRALKHVGDYADVLAWQSLVGPFVRLEVLKDHQAELESIIVRVANLIAKADGQVLPSETAALRSIQASLDAIFAGGSEAASQGIYFDDAGEKIAQAIDSDNDRKATSRREKPKEKPPRGLDMPRGQAYEEAMRELGGLIGLDNVKHDIRELASFLRVQRARKQHGLPATDISLHAIFRGNPGTGKTTVARILGRILYGLELLEKGHTVEVDRAGFVAEYVGQTAPKSHALINSALGGVLFVDEAYSLITERGEDPFGREAVQVLLKRIEDDRDKFVAVLAGYPVPVQRLLSANPGLSSRFQRTFDFPDFSAEELLQIFESMCKTNHYVLSVAAHDKLLEGLRRLCDRRDEHFGNARLARNIFERAVRRMAMRISPLVPLTHELLTTLEAEDLLLESA